MSQIVNNYRAKILATHGAINVGMENNLKKNNSTSSDTAHATEKIQSPINTKTDHVTVQNLVHLRSSDYLIPGHANVLQQINYY